MADRPENFFLHAARRLLQISIDRRLHVKAVVQSVAERGNASSSNYGCTFFPREMIVGKNFFPMLGRNQRPHFSRFLERRPDAQTLGLALEGIHNRTKIGRSTYTRSAHKQTCPVLRNAASLM